MGRCPRGITWTKFDLQKIIRSVNLQGVKIWAYSLTVLMGVNTVYRYWATCDVITYLIFRNSAV